MWLRQNRNPPHSTRRALFLSSQSPAHWKWHVKVAPGSRRQNQSREYHCVWSPLEQCLYVRSFSKLDSRESDRTENICVSTKSCTMLRIMRMQAKWGKNTAATKKKKKKLILLETRIAWQHHMSSIKKNPINEDLLIYWHFTRCPDRKAWNLLLPSTICGFLTENKHGICCVKQ